MYKRILTLSKCNTESAFLWGARQTGKSTLLRALYPEAKVYDLLLADEYRRLVSHPELIRQECLAAGLTGETQKTPLIIDEIQKISGNAMGRGVGEVEERVGAVKEICTQNHSKTALLPVESLAAFWAR